VNTVFLHDTAYKEMALHLSKCYPSEGCGFLLGADGDRREVRQILPVPNVHEGDHRKRYRITPEDYRTAERFAAQHDLMLLGIYHSHPDHPAQPSEEDRIQAMPFFSYVIASVSAAGVDTVTSWQLNGGGYFEKEGFEITGN
jgi:proteasome lid subunit RPN8/RPN11